MENIQLKELKINRNISETAPVFLTEETMIHRKNKVLKAMNERNIDVIVIYGDLEHGSNFEYLTGFLTRFEEACLVLHKNGNCYLMLGNENLNKASIARIKNNPIHVPAFSLPNQPMDCDLNFSEYFKKAKISLDMRVGVVGWKLFTSSINDNSKTFEIPSFIIESLKSIVDEQNLINATDIFISPEFGVRITNNANEVARYEYWSQLASVGITKAIDELKVGQSEIEVAEKLNIGGQPNNVVTIAATGARFENANLYPTNKEVKLGDPISLTVGYKGGLSSRAGYVVEDVSQLPEGQKDYVEKLAGPYYSLICKWLEFIKIEKSGCEIYDYVESVFSKANFGWKLNPGHLIAEEEWMSSPIYPASKCKIKSGMLLQTDIIPKIQSYAGTSCESGILIADEKLQDEIKSQYPELYTRFMHRREFATKCLNLKLSEEVLFMNDTVAVYKPLMLGTKFLVKK
ncbi:MAG: M24 family metallopeptidase [Bacilli bacterium]